MSTTNGSRAIQAAAVSLFGSDGRIESRFRGGWRVAPASSIDFSHKSMWGLLTPRGTFTGITGEVRVTDDGYVTGKLNVDAGSIATKYDRLTTHLRSADGPDRATVNGHLTILGKTQHISFPVRTRLERPNEVAVTGSTTVNRNDYGMSFDKLRASRGLTAVAFSLHLTQQ
jgi:polyisoprenoid-binding protein YceI